MFTRLDDFSVSNDPAVGLLSVEGASFCEVSSMVILRVGTTKRNTRKVGMDFL